MGDSSSGVDLVYNQLGLTFDNTKTLNNSADGPKFLVVSRTLTNDQTLTLNNVSPFLIKKVIDSTCDGEVELCKKLRNGTLLIQTKNHKQATKLIKLRSLAPGIHIDVTEHNTLNFTKGVIYSNDLRGITNEEIIEELKYQKVVKVDKILKKADNILVETGLIIVTFASLSLPESLYIGYEKVKIRPYIPRPLRCNNCYLYGHSSKFCKNEKTCPNCAHLHHINSDLNEICNNIKACINCKSQNPNNFNHAAFDKQCPTFLREKEIQAIITLEKTNRQRAINLYRERQPQINQTYANIAKTSTRVAKTVPITTKTTANLPHSSNTPRDPIDYSDIMSTNEDPEPFTPPKTQTKPTVTILPRGISKRTRLAMKKAQAASIKNP